MANPIYEVVAVGVAQVLNVIGDKNAEEIEELGIKVGQWLNDNVSEKLPSGQTFENVSEENVTRFLVGVKKGLNLDEE